MASLLGVSERVLDGAFIEPIGTGQIAESYRVRFASDRPDQMPESLVVKCTSPDETSRASAVLLNLYSKEVNWYRELQCATTVRMPYCYGGLLEGDGGYFTLALEDCAPATQGNQLAGADLPLLEAALSEAARLHAPFIGDTEVLAKDWLQNDDETQAMIRGSLGQFWPAFKERYRDRLDDDLFDLGDAFVERVSLEESPPDQLTVTHGDFRIDNMLFGHPDGRVIVLDWQTVSPGHPLSDVAYLLGTSVADRDERRCWEESLVRRYCNEMAAQGAALDWDSAWRAYRRYAGNGFAMAITASMLAKRTERGDEMFAVMAERPARQMMDLDTLSLI